MTGSDTDTTAPLEGELTIFRAVELKPRIMGLIANAETPCLDLSEVTELDTAGLQLLLLARRSAAAAGKRLRLIDPSPGVLAVLELCHLKSLLDPA